MRGLYLLLFLALVVNVAALGQSNGDYRSKQTGPWNQASTWEVYSGGWIAAASTPTFTDGVITISDGTTINIPTGVSVTADQIEYENNFGGTTGVLLVDAGGTLTINNGTGNDVRLLNDFTTVALLRVSGTLVLNAGATIVDDDYGNLGIGPGPVSTDTYHIMNGGVHNHQIAAVQVSQVPNADWQSGSTCQVTPVGGAPTTPFLASSLNVLIDNTTQFYNFTWSGSGQTATINLAGNLRTVKQNLLIDGTGGSILQLSTTQAYTLAVTQNFTIQNNARVQFTSSGNPVVHNISGNLSIASSSSATNAIQANAVGTVTVNVTGNFSKSDVSTFNLTASTGATTLNLRTDFSLTGGTMTKSGAGTSTVNFLGSSTVNFTNTATMSNAVAYVVQNGKVMTFGSTSAIAGTGPFTLQTGATLQISSPDGLSVQANKGNITTTGTRTYQAGANIIYNGATAQNLGDEWANALNGVAVNLEINNSSTGANSGVTNNNLNNTTSVVGNLKLTKGALRIGGSKTLSIRSNFSATNGTIAGSSTSKLYFIASGSVTGNLNMEPGADSLSVLWNFRTNDLTLGTNLTVVDSLRFQNGGCLLINGHTLESDGIAILESGSGGIRSAVTTSNVTFGGSGLINATNTVPFATKQAGVTVTNEFGNITLNRTGATYTFSGSNNINGTLGLSVGTITTDVGIFMKAGSTFARDAGTTFSGNTPNATSTYNVSYSGNVLTPTNELPDATSGKLMNLTIAGNLNLDRDLLIKGDLTIASGLFDAGTHDINIAGSNLVVSGGSFTISNSHTFTFSKAGTTTMSGSTINNSTFGNFTINSGTTVVAPGSNANINVGGQWDNNGTFTANGGTVTFNGGAQNIDAAGQSFFNLATKNGTKTLVSNLDVDGQLTINSASTLFADTYNVNVGGVWANSGTYSYTAGSAATVIFDGTNQSINSNGANFNNVTLANSGTKTLAAAIAIKGNLVINSGVTFDVSSSNFNLNVAKDFTNNGTLNPRSGTVFFDGSIIQTIGGSTNTVFNNITTSNASTVTFSSDQSLSNVLTLNSGTFSPNNHFTMLSTSSRDARIAQLGATATIDNTSMTIQRYLPGFAATNNYRYIASSISNGTVAGWQDDFPVTGSFTGSSTIAQWPQFPSMTQNASMWRYKENQAGNPAVDNRYATYPVASNTEPTTKGVGYVAWIRQTGVITIEQVGAANFGPVGVTVTNQAGLSNDGWNLIGNPYPSPINWENVSIPAGVAGQIAVKDNMNNIGLGAGAFVYYTQGNPSLAVPATYDGTLASGQAFFIRKTTSGSTTLTFQEDDKNAVSHPAFIREGIVNLLRINVTDQQHADELLIHFEDNAQDIADGYLDAFKMPNDFISFSSTATDGVELAINTMGSLSCSKQIPLHLNNVTAGSHIFTFSQFESFSPDVRLRLMDTFTGTSFEVTKDNPIYNFEVTSDSASFGNGRFAMFIGYHDFDLSLKVETANVCAGADASVKIYAPEAGVTYYATLDGTTISDQVVGVSGQNLVLTVPKSKLGSSNNIVLMAKIGDCASVPLVNHATIDVRDIPSVSGVTNATSCGAGSLTLTASGAPADGGSYRWYLTEDATDAIAGASSSSYTTPALTKTKTYFVSAVNSLGCEGTRTAVTATIAYMDAPTITVEGNVLKSSYTTGNQWYLNGEAIQDATGQTYQASQTGTYKLVVTAGTCSNEVEQEFSVTGDLEESIKGYTIYPNTTTGIVNIEVGTIEPVTVSVRNQLGVEVTRGALQQEGEARKGQLDITGHAAGVYMVVIQHGGNTVVRKIVKN